LTEIVLNIYRKISDSNLHVVTTGFYYLFIFVYRCKRNYIELSSPTRRSVPRVDDQCIWNYIFTYVATSLTECELCQYM